MNLVVCIDNENRILPHNVLLEYIDALWDIKNLVKNKTVIFNLDYANLKNQFSQSKKFFLNKKDSIQLIPDYLSNDLQKRNKLSSFKQLFELKNEIEENNLFLLTNDYIDELINYFDFIYVYKFNVITKYSNFLLNLIENKSFDLVSSQNSYFEVDNTFAKFIYKNLDVIDFNSLNDSLDKNNFNLL